MRTRALLIHASGCSGSLAVPNCQPILQKTVSLTYQKEFSLSFKGQDVKTLQSRCDTLVSCRAILRKRSVLLGDVALQRWVSGVWCCREHRGFIFKGQKIQIFQLLKMRPPCCLITMRTNHPVMWSHISEEQRPKLHGCKSPKTRTVLRWRNQCLNLYLFKFPWYERTHWGALQPFKCAVHSCRGLEL